MTYSRYDSSLQITAAPLDEASARSLFFQIVFCFPFQASRRTLTFLLRLPRASQRTMSPESGCPKGTRSRPSLSSLEAYGDLRSVMSAYWFVLGSMKTASKRPT